jgi:UDP-N-acetylmuramate dehydrogenase
MESTRLIEETILERERRHLQNVQAAGSFFMNPVASLNIQQQFELEKGSKSRGGRVPAGWLIEKAGMKGTRIGDAIASLQHPNYLVNAGAATARDVQLLAERIKKAVFDTSGIALTEEAQIIE